MKNKFKILKKYKVQTGVAIVLSLAAYLGVTLINSGKVSAQNEAPLIVAPARQVLSSDPGKTASFAIRFYNTSGEPITGNFKVADFIVKDNQGTPTFLEGPTTLSNRYAAAKWVDLSADKGTIPAGGMVVVDAKIRIPANAYPGGKYFAVFFEPTTNVPEATGARQEEAASVTLRIAGLVYLRVNGPISEGASIIKFSAPSFSEFGPIDITTEIKNNGDYHITPVGQITIKDIFGQEISKVNLQEANIFPGSSRVSTTQVGEKWMIGKFTANLNTTYGESNKALAASLVFWVFPWKLATVILLGMIIIILIIIIIVNKFIRKEKRLETELSEEKEELEKLKESFKDKISEMVPAPQVKSPSTEEKDNS